MLKRKISLLIRCGVSISLIILILLRSDLNGAFTALQEINGFLFGASLLVLAFNVFVRSYKWQLLLRAQDTHISLLKVHNLNYMSLFFNNLFFGSLGGDAFRVYKAFGYSSSKSSAASSVIMERVTGFGISLVLVLVVGCVFMPQTPISTEQLIAFMLICLTASLVLFVIFKHYPKLMNLVTSNKLSKFTKVTKELRDSIWAYKNHQKTIILALLLSLLYHIGNSVALYYFSLAANTDISFMSALFIGPLVALLVMVPVSINGIGIQEGSYIFYLEQIGADGPSALLVAILSRVALLVFSLIGGLLFLVCDEGRRPVSMLAK